MWRTPLRPYHAPLVKRSRPGQVPIPGDNNSPSVQQLGLEGVGVAGGIPLLRAGRQISGGRPVGSARRDSLSEWRVIHPEHVPGSICIPPAPDASASTLPARAPCAGCGAHFNRQVNELLHEEAYFLNHAPSCDDAAHGEV